MFPQEGKKAFDKQTQKFCASLDRYLSLKTKVNDAQLQEVHIWLSYIVLDIDSITHIGCRIHVHKDILKLFIKLPIDLYWFIGTR